MNGHKALHPRDDVDRLYVSKKECERKLSSFEDNVPASIQRLKNHIEKPDGGLIISTRNDTDDTNANRMTITKKTKKGKKHNPMGFYTTNKLHHTRKKTWTWLRKGNHKR